MNLSPTPTHADILIVPARRDWIGLTACIAAGALVLALSWFKLSSVDLGYHVAYGRVFLATGRIVDRDPFIVPENAVRFVNANWGAQVVMALAERGGAAGLTALRITLIALTFACIGSIVHRSTKSLTWTAAAWIAAALGAYERFSMRPELFSFAAMAAIVLLLTRGIDSWRRAALVGLIQLLWVNLHSYFLVGPMLTACWAAFALLSWMRDRHDKRRARRAILISSAFALQVGACLVNPKGYEGARFPVDTLRSMRASGSIGGGPDSAERSSWAAISEFHSPFAYAGERTCGHAITAYWVLIGLAALGVLAAVAGGRWPLALALVLLFAMSVQMRRNIALLALAGTPLAVVALASIGEALVRAERGRRRLRAPLALLLALFAIWITIDVVRGRFYYTERRVACEFGFGYSRRAFPLDAAQVLARHPDLQPKLYADFFTSSNLLPWLPERFKLFVDTNTFAYAPETLTQAQRLERGIASHAAFFDEHGVNVVLLNANANTQKLVTALADDPYDWELIHLDRHFVLFIRRTVEHVPILKEYDVKPDAPPTREWANQIQGTAPQRAVELYLSAVAPTAVRGYESAIVLLNEAVAAAPDFDEAWDLLAACHAELAQKTARQGRLIEAVKEYGEAVRCYQAVVSLNPQNADAANKLQSIRSFLDTVRAPGQ